MVDEKDLILRLEKYREFVVNLEREMASEQNAFLRKEFDPKIGRKRNYEEYYFTSGRASAYVNAMKKFEELFPEIKK